MIIDFHTHIFPENIRANREHFFQGETAFELLYRPKHSKLIGVRDLIDAMDENGIDRSVVFGFPWKNPETVRRHNNYVMEAVGRFPSRIIGFCCVDPYHKTAPDETKRCLEAGLAGIGELAFYESGIDETGIERLEPIMALCRDMGVPTLIHTNEPVGHVYPGKTPLTIEQIFDLVSRFQNNKIILAHWGGGAFFYCLMKKSVKSLFKNVYVDTAASPYLYDPAIYSVATQILGSEKILFGSDYPLIAPKRYFQEMKKASLTPGNIANICGRNAGMLLNVV
ncbi:MAG: amidohydrolase [Deltaproteobacteria bacterium]|nr:amidohydrolase [Deltaproteobacteria bacterium]